MTSKENKTELVFAPLGGCNEIGMNLNAYGFGKGDRKKWIVVDIGVSFADPGVLGVDVIMPDPSFLEDKDVIAIILTHAHEDHIGAIHHLWHAFECPVYCTPFTERMIAHKLAEAEIEDIVPVREVALGSKFDIGPFHIEYVTLTHSIPEPNALAITTELGTILHTGDWKFDDEPQIGRHSNKHRLEQLGEKGILAMVCDSTNVYVEGVAGSENDVKEQLTETIRAEKGRVVVTAFASNVARLKSIMEAARKAGRHICLLGMSMHRIVGIAQSLNLFQDSYSFIPMEKAGGYPVDEVLYLCTGSQGEPRAALSRLARGDNRYVKLEEDDAVIFSSRVIPGNEMSIFQIHNQLAELGVKIISDVGGDIHVSGHPCRDELIEMYSLIRPEISVPVHGERRHIIEHARLAKSLQVETAITPKNGDVWRLAPGSVTKTEEFPAKKLMLDGYQLVDEDSTALKERSKIAWNGYVHVVVTKTERKGGAVSHYTFKGLFDDLSRQEQYELEESLYIAIGDIWAGIKPTDHAKMESAAKLTKQIVRRACRDMLGKKPVVDVSLI